MSSKLIYLTLGNHSASNPRPAHSQKYMPSLQGFPMQARAITKSDHKQFVAIIAIMAWKSITLVELLEAELDTLEIQCGAPRLENAWISLKSPPHLMDVHFLWTHWSLEEITSIMSWELPHLVMCIRLQLLRPRPPCLKFTWGSYRFYILTARHQNQARHLWEWGSKARKRGPGIPKSQGNYTLPHCLDSCRNFSLLMIPKLQFCNLITCYNLSREDMELMEKITKKITIKRQPTIFSYKKPGTVSHCWQWRPAKQVDLEGRILTPLIHGITVTILLYPTKNPKCILL